VGGCRLVGESPWFGENVVVDDGVIERIRGFLATNVQRGYGGGMAEQLPDGTTRIRFEREGIMFDDAWSGGDPFGGRILVSVDGRPTWLCVYYGAVTDGAEDPWAVYSFLRQALLAAPDAFPVRGSSTFAEGELRYRCSYRGDLGRFAGHEQIGRRRRRVYEGTFAGGLVDRRRG
jgi:hypothetical protein